MTHSKARLSSSTMPSWSRSWACTNTTTRQRVLMTPEEYRAEMTTGSVGRLDLDGICPYTGDNDDGTLRRPSEEELDVMFRAKAKEEEWMQGEKMYGGRPRDMLMPVIQTIGDL